MRHRMRLIFSFPILLALGCGREPTLIELPVAAESVQRFTLASDHAAQTQFTLHGTYPATPALEFYRTKFAQPWVYCDYGKPGWDYFYDGQGKTPFAVHQQLHMWVNTEAQRAMLLSTRYESAMPSGDRAAARGNAPLPDDDIQNIVVVEYLHADVASMIEALRLHCPSKQSPL